MGFKPRTTSRTENKTRPTAVEPSAFIAALNDERRRRESDALIELMREVTGEEPVMWGPSIVGFGSYHYKYESGREGDMPRAGFSPRKAAMTVYCTPGFTEQSDLLEQLGPHKTGSSCLYIRRLDDVDLDVLRQIVARSVSQLAEICP